MCDYHTPCECLERKTTIADKVFNLLLLDCWQREYDHRPYRNFKFKLLDFEERMGRAYHSDSDFAIIIEFLHKRNLCTASLTSLTVLGHRCHLLCWFVRGLFKLRRIELKLMSLPPQFFALIHKNVTNMNVSDLILTGTPMTTADVEALQGFLIKTRTLRFLNVANCSITQYDFALLADGIHKSITLSGYNASRLLGQTLTLDSQKIAYIVSSLIWQNKLTEIAMQHCEFTAQDMEIIAEYLWNKNSKLEKLNLAYNIIASDGAEYLFRAIVNSRTLRHLNISSNGLGSHGGDVVVKYLSSCYRLEYLDITYNEIGSETMSNVLTCMKKPVKLLRLNLYGNKFNSKAAKVLRRLLDARVVQQESIDITVTYDETIMDYRIIPFL